MMPILWKHEIHHMHTTIGANDFSRLTIEDILLDSHGAGAEPVSIGMMFLPNIGLTFE
jgi:hypothetical protein